MAREAKRVQKANEKLDKDLQASAKKQINRPKQVINQQTTADKTEEDQTPEVTIKPNLPRIRTRRALAYLAGYELNQSIVYIKETLHFQFYNNPSSGY